MYRQWKAESNLRMWCCAILTGDWRKVHNEELIIVERSLATGARFNNDARERVLQRVHDTD